MSSKKVFGVLLTEQAWNELGSALEPYTSTGPLGRYIYCEEVKTGGQYFVMVATCKNTDGSSFTAELAIHHHFVKMFISANEKTEIGFIK